MPNDINLRHWHFIDRIEMLAIILVVFYHGCQFPRGFPISPSIYALWSLSSPCVPLFFFANGFLLYSRPFNLKRHMKKMSLLLAVALFWQAITPLILAPITNTPLSFSEYLQIAWFWKTGWNNQLWFMWALVGIYIVFPILKCCFDYSNGRSSFLFFFACCFLLTIGNVTLDQIATVFRFLLTGNRHIVDFNFFGAANLFGSGIGWQYGYSFFYFCLGGIFWRTIPRLYNIPKRKYFFISILLLIVGYILLWTWGLFASDLSNQLWDPIWNGYTTLPTVFITLGIVLLIFRTSVNNHVLDHIAGLVARNTLGVFLIHSTVLVCIRPVAGLLFGSNIYSVLGSLCYCTFSFLVSFSAVSFHWKYPWNSQDYRSLITMPTVFNLIRPSCHTPIYL